MSINFDYINLHDKEMKLRSEESKDEDEEEEVEAISLCDFPLNSNESENNILSPRYSQPSDFFEFFNDSISEEPYDNMSHAEDIILCGKLLPYKLKKQPNNPFDHQIIKSMSQEDDDDDSSVYLPRRYCESLHETNVSGSNSTKNNAGLMRSSRSLDYNKLRRNSSLVMKSEVSDIRRSFSKGSMSRRPLDDDYQYVLKGSSSFNKNYKQPSWYVLMFGGLVKVNQPELDIRDMKLRQSRRRMCTVFSGIVAGDGNIPATKRRGLWRRDLLEVLSCKSHTSLAFTEPSTVPCHDDCGV